MFNCSDIERQPEICPAHQLRPSAESLLSRETSQQTSAQPDTKISPLLPADPAVRLVVSSSASAPPFPSLAKEMVILGQHPPPTGTGSQDIPSLVSLSVTLNYHAPPEEPKMPQHVVVIGYVSSPASSSPSLGCTAVPANSPCQRRRHRSQHRDPPPGARIPSHRGSAGLPGPF